MRVAVLGAGYVGLVTATCLAELGHDVVCVDIDEKRVEALKEGVYMPFYEPGLAELIARNDSASRLKFATSLATASVVAFDVYFIAVGTPPLADGSADTSAVFAAADSIRRFHLAMTGAPAVLAVKSTVPVGTCAELQDRVSDARLDVVSNPEFLKEGDALRDFFHPDRIVIGQRRVSDGFTWPRTPPSETMLRLYAPLQVFRDRIQVTDWFSSEMVKYASNTMLAMRVSFMNEMSRLCHVLGADIHAVRAGVGSDSRIGPRFLYAGPGYGGSCFPKDVQALVDVGKRCGVSMHLAKAAHVANEEQALFLVDLLRGGVGGFEGKTIAFWGLAFKAETDDVREAPSVRLARAIAKEGGRVIGHDPEAGANFHLATGATTDPHEYQIVQNADALVLLTEWRCYRCPDFAAVKRAMRGDFVLDARNIWQPAEVRAAGLRYQGVGVL